MRFKTLHDVDVKGKTVLFRAAYDIGVVEGDDGAYHVKDTRRIEATLPTLQYLLQEGCKIVVLTWVKRPAGTVVEKLRTTPHAQALSRLLGRPVQKVDSCVGPEVDSAVSQMKPGDIVMLENVRFYPEEEEADEQFARALCAGKDIIVYDAFAHSHRVHASTVGILNILPSVAGKLMVKEMEAYERILEKPDRPLVVLLGGAKISDKLDTLRFLLNSSSDIVLIGGALANTFFAGLGKDVGGSLVESSSVDKKQKEMDFLAVAADLYQTAARSDESYAWPIEAARKLVLPVDMIASSRIEEGAPKHRVDVDNGNAIDPSWKFLDIGPRTVELYSRILSQARTVFWNGPMGYFEVPQFGVGTRQIAESVAQSPAFSIVAGGDTETILEKYGMEGRFDHVSTGGGVSLRILAGKELPVIQFLQK